MFLFGAWPEPFAQITNSEYPSLRILCSACRKQFDRPEAGVAFDVFEKRGNFKPLLVRKTFHARCVSPFGSTRPFSHDLKA